MSGGALVGFVPETCVTMLPEPTEALPSLEEQKDAAERALKAAKEEKEASEAALMEREAAVAALKEEKEASPPPLPRSPPRLASHLPPLALRALSLSPRAQAAEKAERQRVQELKEAHQREAELGEKLESLDHLQRRESELMTEVDMHASHSAPAPALHLPMVSHSPHISPCSHTAPALAYLSARASSQRACAVLTNVTHHCHVSLTSVHAPCV